MPQFIQAFIMLILTLSYSHADILMAMDIEQDLPNNIFLKNTSGDIGSTIISRQNSKAQTFSLPQSVSINGLVLKVYELETSTDITLSIYQANGQGQPSGMPIYSGEVSVPNSLTENNFMQLNFAEQKLEKGDYAFTISASKGIISLATNSAYDGQSLLKKSGYNWVKSSSNDGNSNLIFALTGEAKFRLNTHGKQNKLPPQKSVIKKKSTKNKDVKTVKKPHPTTFINNLDGKATGKSILAKDNNKAQTFRIENKITLTGLELELYGKKNNSQLYLSIYTVKNKSPKKRIYKSELIHISSKGLKDKIFQIPLPNIVLNPDKYIFILKAETGQSIIATNTDFDNGEFLRNNQETEGWELSWKEGLDLKFALKGY